jgi:hypothetical protein
MALAIQFYADLRVAIDGNLQQEAQKLDVRCSAGRIRVYMRSVVPQDRLEFDARESVASERMHRVHVVTSKGEQILRAEMKVKHFAIGQTVNKMALARYIFECERDAAEVAPAGEPTREYYEGKAKAHAL